MNSQQIPVRIHFSTNFPIETRCKTTEDEYAVMEILKVEYGLDPNGENYDITFFVTGIKAFSMSDDDQECLIAWTLKDNESKNIISKGTVGTGKLEMGERFNECECYVKNVSSGDYLFEIEYI